MIHQENVNMINEEFHINRIMDITKNYLILKNQLIEKLLGTDIYPYVLMMKYLVGELENFKLTDSPTKFWPYLNIEKGINQLNKCNLNERILTDWVVFERVKEIPNKMTTTDPLELFLIFKIQGDDLKYMFFGIYKEKVLNEETTISILDKEKDIQDAKLKYSNYLNSIEEEETNEEV